MKKTILTCLIAAVLLSSCGSDKAKTEATDNKETAGFTSEDTEKEGSFTVDGQNFKGNITLQKMAQDQYSVLCQQDSPFSLLQLIFFNEKEARSNATLNIANGFYSMDPGEVHVAVTVNSKMFSTTDNSTGSISVAGNSVTLKDLVLFDIEKKESKKVNTTLEF